MSLQTRLQSFITAVGADIKSLNTQMAGKLGVGAKAADSELLDGLDSTAYAKISQKDLLGWGQLEPHGTYSSFTAIDRFGVSYVQGGTGGPGISGGMDQYYVYSMSLGSEYPYSQYVYQVAYKRGVGGVFASRHREAGTWSAWTISTNVKVADSELLDGLNSTAFLRTDINTIIDGGGP